jgi:hypothetical protein
MVRESLVSVVKVRSELFARKAEKRNKTRVFEDCVTFKFLPHKKKKEAE